MAAFVPLLVASQKSGVPYQNLIEAIKSKTLATQTPNPPWFVDMTVVNAWVVANMPGLLAVVTRAAFVARFTVPEQVAIASNPEALVWWLNLMDVPQVNLANAQVIADMQGLVSLGIIDQARMTTILTP